MKILFFIRTLNGGGAQKIMTKLANAASKGDHEVVVATLSSSGSFSELLRPEVKVIDLGVGRMLAAFRAFSKVIKSERPDILFSTEVAVNVFTLISKWLSGVGKSTKVVIREALSPSLAAKYSKHRSIKYGYSVASFFYPKADHVIAISEGMVSDLVNICKVSEENLTVINVNPCVDERLLDLKHKEPDHPWLRDQKLPCAICVGRLAYQKGFDDAIRAVVSVNETRSLRLLIVGEGEERSYLEGLIKEFNAEDYIQLVGETKNPYAYMAKCSLFLMPSRYEGLGNVLIEAVACGAKCIAYDCPVGPSETLAGGKYGKLVKVNDLPGLTQAIRDEIDRDYDRAAIVEHGQTYTSENGFSKYEAVFEGLDAGRDK